MIWFFSGDISYSQENLESNLNSADNLITESFTPLGNRLITLGKENFYLITLDSSRQEEIYLAESIRKNFPEYKFIIGQDFDSADYNIVFKNVLIGTKYKKIFTDNLLGTKKVKREVRVSYDIDLINERDSSLVYNQSFDKKHKDSFDLNKLDLVEDTRYTFSQSILPEESAANQIFYPAVIITASALAIILFFIIRSN